MIASLLEARPAGVLREPLQVQPAQRISNHLQQTESGQRYLHWMRTERRAWGQWPWAPRPAHSFCTRQSKSARGIRHRQWAAELTFWPSRDRCSRNRLWTRNSEKLPALSAGRRSPGMRQSNWKSSQQAPKFLGPAAGLSAAARVIGCGRPHDPQMTAFLPRQTHRPGAAPGPGSPVWGLCRRRVQRCG